MGSEPLVAGEAMYVHGLVSTIIPVYNRPNMLREAVHSVLRQTYRPIEILIVDDGSTDETPAVVDELGATYAGEVRVLHQANSGVGAAREAARQIARGEFIQYLDSDDLLYPSKFEQQVAGLRAYPDCGVAYCKTDFRVIGSTAPPVAWKRTGESIATMFPSFLASRWWGTVTPLYRRTLTDRNGPWLGLINEEDWEYDCRLAKMGVKLYFADEFLAEHRHHTGERLSQNGYSPPKLRSRALAHMHMYQHAQQAGIARESTEMRHFARELFLLSRQCGAAGLGAESAQLFELACAASEEKRAQGMDFVFYRLITRVLGWSVTGWLACQMDRLR